MRTLIRYLALTSALGVAGTSLPLFAHALGEDYIVISFREASIDGHFELHFDDLREKLGVDLPDSESGSVDAVGAAMPLIEAYLLEKFAIGPVDDDPFRLEFSDHEVIELPQGLYAKVPFESATGTLPDQVSIRHEMFYEGDPFHRGLLLLEYNAKTEDKYGPEYTALVFGPTNSTQVLDLNAVPGLISPIGMIEQGVLHIWIGIDHILFLIALILPTVLHREDGTWKAVDNFRKAFWNLLKIVTVFTIAHSVTLLLAALGLLSVPSRFVESMIALSIILVAWNNISGKIRGGSLWVILFLGLFHGLGFASVMGHLPFRMGGLLKSVICFNIGVELGQIAIVMVLFPILFALRNRSWYVPVVLKGGSAVLILVAGYWFLQRALGFD